LPQVKRLQAWNSRSKVGEVSRRASRLRDEAAPPLVIAGEQLDIHAIERPVLWELVAVFKDDYLRLDERCLYAFPETLLDVLRERGFLGVRLLVDEQGGIDEDEVREWALIVVVGIVTLVVIYDITQRNHALLRNFPVIGHFRYLLEGVGPELRQYIVVDNDTEKPFSRDQRRWVYSAAKQENTYFGFGTDNDLEGSPGYVIIKQSSFPLAEPHAVVLPVAPA